MVYGIEEEVCKTRFAPLFTGFKEANRLTLKCMHASDPQHANRLLFLFGRMARRAQQCCGQASVYGVPAAPHAAGQHHQHRLGAVLGERIDRLESAWCVCHICSLCCFEPVYFKCFCLVLLWSCGLVTDTVQAPLEYMNAYSRLVFYSNGARLAVKKIRTSPQQQYGLYLRCAGVVADCLPRSLACCFS